MKDHQNKPQKINNIIKAASIIEGYVIAFQHPISGNLIFLANCADIKSICYSKDPTLPGTLNIKKAKIYTGIQDAKDDIYLLRYHHRQFLQIKIIAKKILNIKVERCKQTNDPQLIYYPISDLIPTNI